jgi:hypothetical protein
MKKLYISLIFGILLIGIVIAGAEITANKFTKEKQIDKVERDYLLTKIPIITDEKGKELPKGLKPKIIIECYEKECKYSAVLDNIIQTYDNIITREYCEKIDEKTGECLKQGIYTLVEIEDQVSDIIMSRINQYSVDDKVTKEVVEKSEGDLIITEKK